MHANWKMWHVFLDKLFTCESLHVAQLLVMVSFAFLLSAYRFRVLEFVTRTFA